MEVTPQGGLGEPENHPQEECPLNCGQAHPEGSCAPCRIFGAETLEGRRARCREAALCTSCLATKSSTHTCVIQKCTLCFGPHNILLCPIEGLEKEVEGDDECTATYSAAQVAESLLGPALGREVPGRGRLPSISGATPDQGPPGTGHPVEALQAGEDHGTPQEEEEVMYSASNEEEFNEPDGCPDEDPPNAGHTIPLRIPTPTEEEVMKQEGLRRRW